jgi:hypothetical protein
MLYGKHWEVQKPRNISLDFSACADILEYEFRRVPRTN